MQGSLVLLTLEFPYGLRETYLETEINYLSEHFTEVHIISSSKKGTPRITPENVIVHSVKGNDKFKPTALVFNFLAICELYFFTFLKSRMRWNYLIHIKSFLHHFQNDYSKLHEIKRIIIRGDLWDSLFYDYWMVNSSLSLIFLKKRGFIKGPIVCRAHGFDLYDERHIEGAVPFQEFKLQFLDKIYPVSSHGKDYLLAKSSKDQSPKIKARHLGVESAKYIPDKGNENIIVSCASMLPFKQIPMLAESINNLKIDVKWVHFGDGPDMDIVLSIAERFPKNISVELKGNVGNNEILKYYENNYVRVFVSLSLSEGLPVSMMEAQSFGIPILALSVNGIPEIVNYKTGMLLPKESTNNDITLALKEILSNKKSFNRIEILNQFQKEFSASHNYTKFCKNLGSLII